MKIKDFLKMHPMFPVVVFFSLAVSGTTFYLKQTLIAYVELALGLLLSVIVLFAELKTYNDLKKIVSVVNSGIVSKREDRISSIPLPFMICGVAGSVIWFNDLFEREVIGKKPLTLKQIRTFVPADRLKDGVTTGKFNITLDTKRYTVHIAKLPEDKSEEYVLFFIDDTYYKDTADLFKNTRPAVMTLTVDAMDAVASMMSQNQFSTLLSDVERMIDSWFTHYKCILRKISDGRYIVIAEYQYFEEMKKADFDILSEVRSHRLEGISVGLTLSVGVAIGTGLFECEVAARKSLDMAKGRGGDQVVINDNGSYEFFGGVAAGVESRNQVQSRIVAGSVEELIKHSSGVLIMGHKNSDLDALGSAIGIAEAVKNLGVEAQIVINEKNTMARPLLEYYKNSDNDIDFISPAKSLFELRDDTLVIVTDVMRPGFADATELVQRAKQKVVIDHHRMSVDHIADSIIFYHEPSASSASEMVTELIKYMPSKPRLSARAAEALLAGIYLDTKNFTLKTGVRTFEAAAYLREIGADTITVRKLFAATAEENANISKIVSNAEIRGNFAFAKTDIHDSSARLVAAKAADDLLNIEDVDASFVIFGTEDGDTAISARSYGRINVQIIMEKLGGGGHQTMAAAQLQNTSIDTACKLLNEAVADFTKRGAGKTAKKEE